MEAEAGQQEDGGLAPRMEDRTLVQFLDLRCSPGPCGYCHGTGSISQGMLVERMTVDDYQALLDRGWRRSGRYVYKPLMETTCCPLYTIRCQAEKFEPSKSQRKVVRRFNNFLLGGKEKETESITSRKEKEDKTVDDMLMDTRENLGSEINKLKRVEGLKKKKKFPEREKTRENVKI